MSPQVSMVRPRFSASGLCQGSWTVPRVWLLVLRPLSVAADHSARAPKPLWLWHSHPDPADLDLARLFAAFCRRFDAEHTFRFCKQTLGWTRPHIRYPQQADRWTWLILAAYTQLRLARHLADDLRRPWQPPLPADRLTPGRVRRGFPRIHRTTARPSTAPKPSTPGPGRPKGRTSPPAPRHPVGKTTVKPHNPKRPRKKRSTKFQAQWLGREPSTSTTDVMPATMLWQLTFGEWYPWKMSISGASPAG
jgi:hypothetical protein